MQQSQHRQLRNKTYDVWPSPILCPRFKSFFNLRFVLFPLPFLAPAPVSANTPLHNSSAVTVNTPVKQLYLRKLLFNNLLFLYIRLLKKLPCLVCCHAASGNNASVVFLWRAPHPNWDVWTAPVRVWSEDAPETPVKARIWSDTEACAEKHHFELVK